jgi:hypothetical protein
MLASMNALLSNDEQLEAIAAKTTLENIERGYEPRVFTREELAEELRRTIQSHKADDQLQHNYTETIESMLSAEDQNLLRGDWSILRTEPNDPFVIGDAPVVTWERIEKNTLMFGQGFGRPNVEALLPLSPTACLHVQPAVERTRPVMTPATVEVNIAEASFATQYCFTNIFSPKLDEMLQAHFGQTRLGVNAFTLRHRDFTNTMYDILMNPGRGSAPPVK